MRLPMRRAAELALGAAAAALLVLLVVPWKAAPLPGAAGSGSSPQPQPEIARQQTRIAVPPDTILRLFTGARPAAQARAAPSPEAKPVDASWLRYMGRSSAPDGTTHVYVKDTKSGKVIRATRGEALDGWTLVSEDASGLMLQYGDELYAVSTK